MDKSDSTALYASKFNPMGYRVTLCDTIASSSLNDIEMIYKKGARHINVRTAMIKIKTFFSHIIPPKRFPDHLFFLICGLQTAAMRC